MTWNNVFCNTFEALSEELGLPPADKSLVELCRADDADFCQEVVAKGWLSEAQMALSGMRSVYRCEALFLRGTPHQ